MSWAQWVGWARWNDSCGVSFDIEVKGVGREEGMAGWGFT